jgi:hypothetical protein
MRHDPAHGLEGDRLHVRCEGRRHRPETPYLIPHLFTFTADIPLLE